MSEPSWHQWQALSALWGPAFAADASQSGAAPSAGGSFAPYEQLAERFKVATEQFAASVAADPAERVRAAQAFSDFLRAQLSVPFSSAPGLGPKMAPPFAPSDWPALGPAREHQQRWQRMNEAAFRAAQAQARLQGLWSDSMQQAASAFASELSERPAHASDMDSWRTVYDAWIDHAERRYAQLAREASFCEAQTDLINAGSAWRHEARDYIEQWCKWLDLPTRSEFNTLIQKLRSLEQMLRAARAVAGTGSMPE